MNIHCGGSSRLIAITKFLRIQLGDPRGEFKIHGERAKAGFITRFHEVLTRQIHSLAPSPPTHTPLALTQNGGRGAAWREARETRGGAGSCPLQMAGRRPAGLRRGGRRRHGAHHYAQGKGKGLRSSRLGSQPALGPSPRLLAGLRSAAWPLGPRSVALKLRERRVV